MQMNDCIQSDSWLLTTLVKTKEGDRKYSILRPELNAKRHSSIITQWWTFEHNTSLLATL